MSITLHTKAKTAPHTAGVYIFRLGKTPVYIGKAADLKKRLASYFRANAAPKVRTLREEADSLEWIELGSEIEALITEADLIKRHLPKYNVLLRDDKSYFYVAVTKDIFPRIFVTHKTNLAGRQFRRVIGPFTTASALYATLKLLRKIFPYCTCKEIHKRPCLNAQIGRCLSFCCLRGEVSADEQALYRHNVQAITAILSGKKKRMLSGLKHSMRTASKNQNYEAAARLRDQIAGLENIFSHEHVLESRGRNHESRKRNWHEVEETIKNLLGVDTKISRVEGYDISNISGTEATGSMVVFINGYPAKAKYKQFKIKTVHQPSDVDMHKEVMRRRLAHPEWGMPDLILMDGGKPQRSAAIAALRESRIKNFTPTPKFGVGAGELGEIKIMALAKREEELYLEGRSAPVRLDALPRDAMLFFQHVRDESHRFAKKYHHKLREIAYRNAAKD